MGFYDVVIVGAGPAGIFTALELKEKAPSRTILLVDEGPGIDRRACPSRQTGALRPLQALQYYERAGPEPARFRTVSSPFRRKWAAISPNICPGKKRGS